MSLKVFLKFKSPPQFLERYFFFAFLRFFYRFDSSFKTVNVVGLRLQPPSMKPPTVYHMFDPRYLSPFFCAGKTLV